MRILNEDPWVSRSLRELGEYSESEFAFLEMMIRMMRCDPVVVDAGAYIGDLTIPLSRISKHVYAFEPQAEVYDVLCHNLEINQVHNVTAVNAALGHTAIEMQYTPAAIDGSPGSTQMFDVNGVEQGVCITLDSLELDVDLIKADVEGMEPLVLAGAQETIKRSKPILFCERDTVIPPEGEPTIQEVYRTLGYDFWNLEFMMWNEKNYNKLQTNPWPGIASFMCLGLPQKR
jgi:FkbM family methyltransferase